MKNAYAIMNKEEYAKILQESTVSDNFPEEPPCEFPMAMTRINIKDAVPSPSGGLYKIMTSWIGISASDIKKIISPYLPGKGMFGPIEFTSVGAKPEDQVLKTFRGLAEHSRATADLWNTVKGAVGNALKQASDDIATEMFTLLEENGYEIVKKGGTSVADKAIRLIASSIAPRPEYTTEVEWALNLAQMLVDQCLRCKGNWTDIRIMRSGIIEVK